MGVRSLPRIAALVVALWLSAAAAQAQTSFTYFSEDLGTESADRVLLVLALQGIVNRDAPSLYVNTATLDPWSADNPKWYGNPNDVAWLSIYGDRGYQYSTVADLNTLLQQPGIQSAVTGLVEYDPTTLPSAAWVAMTVAGAERRLPVTPELLSAMPMLAAQWPNKLDLRSLFADKTSAYQWAIDHYLPSCDQHLMDVIGHDLASGDPGDIISLDYAVARGAFITDLSLNAASAPDEEALAATVFAHLLPPAAILGWSGEVDFNAYSSLHGDYSLNGVGASNLSFHRRIPRVTSGPLVQTVRLTADQLALDPTKYYLAVVTTDGEAPQSLTRLFNGDWLEPERGQVPISWGVDPVLVTEFPALFEYLYSNATIDDYFVAGCSGAGNVLLSLMPDQANYASLVGSSNAAAGIDSIWVLDSDWDADVWDPFLTASGVQTAVVLFDDQLFFRGDHVPFLPGTFSWPWESDPTNTAETIAANIVATMSAQRPPAFAIALDGIIREPAIAKQVMDILAPQGYEFLRLDEMNDLARQIDHFFDVGTKYWAHDQIEACFKAGIVQGYSDNYYQPTDPVTRDQMAVYISRALAGGDAKVPTGPATATFSDVATDYWAFKYVEYAVDQGVVKGYSDGTYKPADQVTRDQMSVFIARAIATPTAGADLVNYTPPTTATFPDVATTFWAYKYVEYIAQPSIAVTKGYPDGDYHPEYVCTRDQMAVYVARAFRLQ
ncbi:MAG: S-layer homology domain-containing protein [Armatimonadota bacterium]|jgi:hypothetical protein